MDFLQSFSRLLFLLLTAFSFSLTRAEAGNGDDGANRPKIGLVLGGGGARGIAHIGVLKVLKELRIPVDYIAGTSMGAIVGGLYASGMSVEEIDQLTRNMDWRDALNDKPSRDFRSYRRKEEDNLNLMGFELGFNGGKIYLPRGIIAGQKLSFVLKTNTLAVAGIHDFDRLPIPFRAVASNIVNGEKVVLSSGNLPEAMRASMSVPSVFSPVEIDNKLLVDGALVDNVPIDIVRNMGADIVIAVDVGLPLMHRDELNSIMGISVQVFNVLTQKQVDEQIATLTDRDVLIRPKLDNIGGDDFLKFKKIITLGESAAWLASEGLKKYSVSEEAYAVFLNKKNAKTTRSIQIDYVQLGGDLKKDKRVYSLLGTSLGKPLDLNQLQKDLTEIYELGDYEQVDFNLLEDAGRYALQIKGKSKSWGPNFLRFGLATSVNLNGEGFINALAHYKMTRLNPFGAEWTHMIRIGDFPRYETEFYQPLSYSGLFFLAPNFSAERFQTNIFVPESPIAYATYSVFVLRYESDLGIRLGNFGQLRGGITQSYGRATGTVGTQLPDFKIHGGGYVLKLRIDDLDSPYFPKRGSAFVTQFYSSEKSFGADSNYKGLKAGGLLAFTKSRHTFIVAAEGGTGLGTQLPVYDKWTLGGFLHLSAYDMHQIMGNHYGFGQLLYMYHFSHNNPSTYSDGIYAGGGIETGNAWDRKAQIGLNKLKYSYSLLVGTQSFIGPIYLGCSFSEKWKRKYYLNIGRTF